MYIIFLLYLFSFFVNSFGAYCPNPLRGNFWRGGRCTLRPNTVISNTPNEVVTINLNQTILDCEGNPGLLATNTYVFLINGRIENCVRLVNSSGDGGGALKQMVYGTIRFTNFTFYNNTVKYVDNSSSVDTYGGALFLDKIFAPFNCIGCVFINNTADYGGAIYINISSTITNSVFQNNSAIEGGAIYTKYTMPITNTFFLDNLASNRGGSIFSDSYLNINNSTFKNSISGSDGGAIYGLGKVSIKNGQFISCSSNNGGALYSGNMTEIHNSTFNRCSTLNFGNGGALYIDSNHEQYIYGTIFSECMSGNGTIYINNSNLYIMNSNFVNNFASQNGGVIYVNSLINNNISIDNSVFINNSGYERGGVIYGGNNSNLYIMNSNFVNNSGNEGGVLNFNSFVNISCSNFYYNTATLGSVLYSAFNGSIIKNGIFVNNTSVDTNVITNIMNGRSIVNNYYCIGECSFINTETYLEQITFPNCSSVINIVNITNTTNITSSNNIVNTSSDSISNSSFSVITSSENNTNESNISSNNESEQTSVNTRGTISINSGFSIGGEIYQPIIKDEDIFIESGTIFHISNNDGTFISTTGSIYIQGTLVIDLSSMDITGDLIQIQLFSSYPIVAFENIRIEGLSSCYTASINNFLSIEVEYSCNTVSNSIRNTLFHVNM